MTYQRMRNRSNLMHRKPAGSQDPYWRDEGDLVGVSCNPQLLIGDLNRMEEDYVDPEGQLAAEVAAATGLNLEQVIQVMRYVLFVQQ